MTKNTGAKDWADQYNSAREFHRHREDLIRRQNSHIPFHKKAATVLVLLIIGIFFLGVYTS